MVKSLDDLVKTARLRMGPTKAIRLRKARERSEEFNRQAELDFQSQLLTPELLAKRCTL